MAAAVRKADPIEVPVEAFRKLDEIAVHLIVIRVGIVVEDKPVVLIGIEEVLAPMIMRQNGTGGWPQSSASICSI
jgi:hypothetical protein